MGLKGSKSIVTCSVCAPRVTSTWAHCTWAHCRSMLALQVYACLHSLHCRSMLAFTACFTRASLLHPARACFQQCI
jgi:hypothetical protein